MSSCQVTPVTCPKCGHSQEFTTWQSINATLNPELKDQLLSGELMRFTCDQCNNSADLVYPFLYHDMKRPLMVWFSDDEAPSDMPELPFAKISKGYELRLVASCNELIEKVWIASADCDDRMMELFKLSMQNQMGKEEDGKLLFSGEQRDEDGTELLSFVWLSDQSREDLACARESYTEFSNGIDEILQASPLTLGEWHRVNQDYALALLERYQPEHEE